jgi:hypothetical protein
MEPPALAAPAPTGRTLAIAGEHALDRTLLQQTKAAIRRLAAEQGIDLGHERVSLWRPRSPQEFEHLASTRSIYKAFQLAETLAEDLFLFDAPAGGVLTLVAGPAGAGK